jgi:hypothetical protein
VSNESALRQALQELYALVKGECSSLLDEDSGGDANLDLRIDAALTAPPAAEPPDLTRPMDDIAKRLDAAISWLRDGVNTGPGVGLADFIALRQLLRTGTAQAAPSEPVAPLFMAATDLLYALDNSLPDDLQREKLRNATVAYAAAPPPPAAPAVAPMEAQALQVIMRFADQCKEPCGMDPESAAAIRNGKFASIAQMAAQGLGLVRGPAFAAAPAQPAPQRQEDASLDVMECGHAKHLLLVSAETGDPLYCELCDLRQQRDDAVLREQELAEVVKRLSDELNAINGPTHMGEPVIAAPAAAHGMTLEDGDYIDTLLLLAQNVVARSDQPVECGAPYRVPAQEWLALQADVMERLREHARALTVAAACLTAQQNDASGTCHIGSCQRNKRCMYTPCRAAAPSPQAQAQPSTTLDTLKTVAREAYMAGIEWGWRCEAETWPQDRANAADSYIKQWESSEHNPLNYPAASDLPERDASKPAEAQGLFRKFDVRRTDGSDAPGGKHDGCSYFVLDVDHDPHAKPALTAYAEAVRATHPLLADDMVTKYGLAQAQAQQGLTEPNRINMLQTVAKELLRADDLDAAIDSAMKGDGHG